MRAVALVALVGCSPDLRESRREFDERNADFTTFMTELTRPGSEAKAHARLCSIVRSMIGLPAFTAAIRANAFLNPRNGRTPILQLSRTSTIGGAGIAEGAWEITPEEWYVIDIHYAYRDPLCITALTIAGQPVLPSPSPSVAPSPEAPPP